MMKLSPKTIPVVAIILASLIVFQGTLGGVRFALSGPLFPGETGVSDLLAGKVSVTDILGRSLTDTMQAVVEAACLATRVNIPSGRPPAPKEDPHPDSIAVLSAFPVLQGLREAPKSLSAQDIGPTLALRYDHQNNPMPRHPPGGSAFFCVLFLICVFVNGMVSLLARGRPCASAIIANISLRQTVKGMPGFSFCGARSASHG